MNTVKTAADVLAFWRGAGEDKWFEKSEDFDRDCRENFLGTYEAAASGQLSDWQQTPDGALALVIVLDQFPRNMFRNDPRAFATDPLALEVARRAILSGFDRQVAHDLVPFLYLPFEHSENIADQRRSVDLFAEHGDENNLKYAEIHRNIIERFGRFPHRNAVLGRQTTPEEKAFLDEGGFSG
ncbi:MAG: DUF924 family protein [Hyphomicrobium sp.]